MAMSRARSRVGTGVGGNMPAFRRVLDSKYSELKPSIYWYRHFHNQYAQVATELGLVGLLALAWIFWTLIREPDRRRDTDAATLVLATVFLLGFLGEPFFHKQITLVMFALFAGLISAEDLEKETSEDIPELTKGYIQAIGGAENIVEVDNCITRLRLGVKDSSLADSEKLKKLGAAGVVPVGKNGLQVIVGLGKVDKVAEQMKQQLAN